MKSSIDIRRLEESDSIEELTRVLNRAYATLAARGLRYVATWQDAGITAERIRGGECWVCEEEGRIVGTILFKPAEQSGGCRYYDRAGVATFHQFGVPPEFRGRGIGGRLLEMVERRALETGAKELALDTAVPAWWLIAMYERRGYRVVDLEDWPETNYESFIMAKPLVSQT